MLLFVLVLALLAPYRAQDLPQAPGSPISPVPPNLRHPPDYQYVEIETNGTIPTPRSGSLLGLTQDGDGLFLLGGTNSAPNLSYFLNFSTNDWTTSEVEFSYTGSCFSQDTLGGSDMVWFINADNQLATYNLTSKTYWSDTKKVPVVVTRSACATLGGKFYVVENCSSNVYVFSDSIWEKMNVTRNNSLWISRIDATLVPTKDGLVWIGGSRCGQETDRFEVFSLDVEKGVWTEEKPTSTTPLVLDATIVYSGSDSLFIFGGRTTYNQTTADVSLFNFTDRTFVALTSNFPSKPEPRSNQAGILTPGRLVLFGGISELGALNDLWTFVTNSYCLDKWNCSQCQVRGCGWCQDNDPRYQCVAGNQTGPFTAGACDASDIFVAGGSQCPQDFPGWIISLIIIGCIVFVGIVVYVAMRLRLNDGYQQVD